MANGKYTSWMFFEWKSDGRVYYNLHGSRLTRDCRHRPFALMEGKKSCHTGWLLRGNAHSDGNLIGNGYADVIGD